MRSKSSIEIQTEIYTLKEQLHVLRQKLDEANEQIKQQSQCSFCNNCSMKKALIETKLSEIIEVTLKNPFEK